MHRWINSVVLLSVLQVGTSCVLAGTLPEQDLKQRGQGDKALTLPECPVMGEPINFAKRVATDDGPAYFCCGRCMEKFQAEPRKYAALVAAQRKALASRPKVQVTCPVSGEAVDQSIFAEYRGQKVYFHSKDGLSKFQKTPKKYVSALANSYTYQTKCPVSGKEIDPAVFSTLASGLKIYFCCQRCNQGFSSKPAEYLPKLAAQGFTIEQEDLKRTGQDG